MDIHPVDVIIMLINIIVLFVLLRLILWKRVSRFLSDRAGRIRTEIDNAAELRRKAASLNSEHDKRLEELEERGYEMIRESQLLANQEAEEILKDAKAKADEMLRETKERMERERKQAIVDAHTDVTRLAAEMAGRILRREVSAADNARTVDDFFRES